MASLIEQKEAEAKAAEKQDPVPEGKKISETETKIADQGKTEQQIAAEDPLAPVNLEQTFRANPLQAHAESQAHLYSQNSNVIRSGERAQSSLTSRNAQVFFHRHRGASFIMPDGLAVVFEGGVFATEDQDIIRELRKVANKQGSQIYTDESVAHSVDPTLNPVPNL